MPRRLLLSFLVILLAGGCGENEPSAQTTPTGAHTSVANLRLAVPGGPVRARMGGDGRLRATTAVAGTAHPGGRVAVDAGCTSPGCAAIARVDRRGRWRARVELRADSDSPFTRITATSGDRVAVALVRIQRPTARRRRLTAGPPLVDLPPRDAPAVPPPSPRRRTLVMIGDSLAVGTKPYLASLLPGWTVEIDAQEDRTLASGMRRLAKLATRPTVLAFSLFTNDGPQDLAPLEAALRRTAEHQRGRGCAIWATIRRPPVNGVSYARANALLRRAAAEEPGTLRLADWSAESEQHREWLAGDHVHATATGYAGRAALYADAARACAR
ncbi:MAG: hypothetical protein H0T43_12625 [Solirubrobacterales bacterium]|nr:hypothetical protein [Solirubrobacterales bacterium]